MPTPKPNHICANCGKQYFACNYCDRTGYKWLACSPECFKQVAWKYGSKYKHLKPQRIDLTDEQIDELLEKPIEEVKKESMAQLKDYKAEIEQIGFDGVVDLINRELNGT